jgi:hypothetical protein
MERCLYFVKLSVTGEDFFLVTVMLYGRLLTFISDERNAARR